MAGRGRQKEYEDALSSIFDFLFEKAKVDSRPLKPTRPTGLSPTDDVAAAMAALATAPANYLTGPLLDSLNSTLGEEALIKLFPDKINTRLNPASDDTAGRFRVRGKELSKFLRDPNAYVEGVFKAAEEERKWARIGGGAGILDNAIAGAWAKRSGLPMSEVVKIMTSSKEEISPSNQTQAVEMVAHNAALAASLNGSIANDPKTIRRASRAIYKAMGTGGRFDLTGFFSSQASYQNLILNQFEAKEAAILRKAASGKALDPNEAAALPALQARLGQKMTAYPNVDAKRAEIISALQAKGFSSTEAQQIATSFEDTVTSSRKGSYTVDGMLSSLGFRSIHQEQLFLKAQLAEQRGDMVAAKKYAKAGNVIDIFNRIRNPEAFGAIDYKSAYGRIDAKIAEANANGWGTAYINDLKNIKSELEKVEAKNEEYRANLTNIGDELYWRPSFSAGLPRSDDRKMVQSAAKLEIDSEIRRLERLQLAQGPGFSKVNTFRLEHLYHLQNRGLRQVPGTNLRILAANMTLLYRSRGEVAGFLPGLFTGAAYFSGSAISPASPGPVSIQYRSRDRSGNTTIKNAGGFLVMPRDDRLMRGLGPLNPAWMALANIYYVTPGSVLKTFAWNGEAFLYMAEMRRRAMMRNFFKSVDRNALDAYLQANPIAGLKSFKGPDDYKKFGENYIEILEGLQGTPFDALAKQMLKRQGTVDRLARIHQIFSAPQVAYTKLLKKILEDNRVAGGFRKMIQAGFNALSKNPVWRAKVNQFMAKSIGLLELIQVGVKLALEGLGIAVAGPLGTVLVWIVTDVVVKVLWKVAKPFYVLGSNALLGAIMLIFFILTMCGSWGFSLMNTTNVHRGQPPVAGGGGLLEEGSSAPIIASAPQNAICPITVGARCAQGPYGRFSHAKMGTFAIDVSSGSWVAPTDGTILSADPDVMCEWEPGKSRGGEVLFQDSSGNTYRIFHVRPVASVGSVNQGDVIAMMQGGLPRSKCWDGAHLHLDTKSGGWVNSEDWYNDLNCNIRCPR